MKSREYQDIRNKKSRDKRANRTKEEAIEENRIKSNKRKSKSIEKRMDIREKELKASRLKRSLLTDIEKKEKLNKRREIRASLTEEELEIEREKTRKTREKKRSSRTIEEIECDKVKKRLYKKKRLENDVNFKLSKSIRNRLALAIKHNAKSGSAIKDLGCSIQEFKIYIENLFEPWMKWDNWGVYDKNRRTWNLDHIIPLSSFDLSHREQFLKACHYANVRPLLALENLKKGSKIS